MLVYTKLWLLLESKGMKRTDLLNVISSATLAKLGKNENVSAKVLGNLCDFLQCQPGDIMENVTKEQLIQTSTEMNKKMEELLHTVMVVTGKSEEELLDEIQKDFPTFIEKIKAGDMDFMGISNLNK